MEYAIKDIVNKWNYNEDFSGVISITGMEGVVYQDAFGLRNRAEKLPNRLDTAYAVASGTKLFTALSICKLIDCGYLSLNDRIGDLIPYDLKRINKKTTVYHLLTHTSGVGDYIDEEAPGDYFDILSLYENRPVHKWESLAYYLPMFSDLPQKFSPGDRFGYSNAGFILLGLIIESVGKQVYQNYVDENIIFPLALTRTGFYRMNNLPVNTALGYVYNETRGEYETNVLYMPVIGGSDGGIYTCAADLIKVWQAVFSNRIFSADMVRQFLTPHVAISDAEYCGLGVFIRREAGKTAYCSVGGDLGVDFFSAYFPRNKIIASAFGNTQMNTFPLFERLFAILG